MPALTARDILDQLDDDARNNAAFFPDLGHGYYYHIDQRLSAYGDEFRWVLIIEQLAVNPRVGGPDVLQTTLYYHGNAIVLPRKMGWGDKTVKSVSIIGNGPSAQLLESDFSETINLAAKDVLIRGQIVPIRTDSGYYAARKIDTTFPLTNDQIDESIKIEHEIKQSRDRMDMRIKSYDAMRARVGKFELSTESLFRGMVPEYRDLLLATEVERREGVPPNLPLLLQIDEWDHPRLLDQELPSSCESFKLIAEVLAHRDPTLYCPKGTPNTHWSNWPESGSL